jgi:hypothetical protein
MLERVENPLPIPEHCDACASFDVTFTNNEAVYGKPHGEWPFVYLCLACGAVVGCHPGTRVPLGRMADKRTRKLRGQAHTVFDPLWQSGAMTRSEAYCWLARHLGITREQCHISQFNVEQLTAVVEHCKAFVSERNIEILKRRGEKKNAKRIKRFKREKQQSDRFSKYSKKRFDARRPRSSDEDC